MATLPTVAELKTYLGISGSGDDTLLGEVLNGAVVFIEEYTGYSLSSNTAAPTLLIKDVVRDHGRLLVPGLWFVSVSNVTTEAGTTLTTSDYFLIPQKPPYLGIRIKPDSAYRWNDGVTGVLDTTTYDLDADGSALGERSNLKHAAVMLAAHWWRTRMAGSGGKVAITQKSGYIQETAQIPQDVIDLLNSSRGYGI